MTGSIAVLCAGAVLARTRRTTIAMLVVAAALVDPLAGIAAGAAAAAFLVHRRRGAVTSLAGRTRTGEVRAVELLSLAVTAGLPFLEAVDIAAAHLDGSPATRLRSARARASVGLPPSVGPGILADAFTIAERSAVTGAPLSTGLSSLAARVVADEHATRREAMQRLPVKMLFPLAFLILPGFVLVLVVPPLVSGLGRLAL